METESMLIERMKNKKTTTVTFRTDTHTIRTLRVKLENGYPVFADRQKSKYGHIIVNWYGYEIHLGY